ncbi:NAD-dependent glutamate dehydrogenase [Rhizoclosmatium sp. JEL0117]|nr:NAD-dependent glutamate dehydrogenase [Rhizoclosmatium sp. JEL0117]
MTNQPLPTTGSATTPPTAPPPIHPFPTTALPSSAYRQRSLSPPRIKSTPKFTSSPPTQFLRSPAIDHVLDIESSSSPSTSDLKRVQSDKTLEKTFLTRVTTTHPTTPGSPGITPRKSFGAVPSLLLNRASFHFDTEASGAGGVVAGEEEHDLGRLMRGKGISPWAAAAVLGSGAISVTSIEEKELGLGINVDNTDNDSFTNAPALESVLLPPPPPPPNYPHTDPLKESREETLKRAFIIHLSKCFFKFGAPTHQLEPHLTQVSKALDLQAEFLLLPGIVLISFGGGYESKVHFVKQHAGMNMSKLAQTNALCQTVTKRLVDVYNAVELLEAIESAEDYPWWVNLVTFPITSFCFALLMFYTTWFEAGVAGILGFIAGAIYVYLGSSVFIFLPEFLAGLCTAFIAKAVQNTFYANGICFDPLKVTLAALIMFLPGMSLTISVIELSTKNLVSGTIRMFQALFCAMMLGFGITVGESLVLWPLATYTAPTCAPTTQLWAILFFVPMAMSINILFQANKHQFGIMCFTSFVGYAIYNLVNLVPFLKEQPIAVNTIVSAAIGITGNICQAAARTLFHARLLSSSSSRNVVQHGFSSLSDKSGQVERVKAILENRGFIPKHLIGQEVDYFFGKLGISDLYFKVEPAETVANHILSLYSAKIVADVKHESVLDINLEKQTDSNAVFIHTNIPGVGAVSGKNYEKIIDEKYLDITTPFRLESYRSESSEGAIKSHLRSYFLNKCSFPPTPTTPTPDIRAISDAAFSEAMTDTTEKLYTRVIQQVLAQTGPVIEVHDVASSGEKRLVVGFKTGTARLFLSAVTDLYKHYGLRCSKKFVEPFSNGVTVISLYLGPSLKKDARPFEYSVGQVAKETSLLICLPSTPFQDLFKSGKLCVQEAMYAYTNWIFAQHFVNRLGSEYTSLQTLLDGKNNRHVEVLSKIKKRLRTDTFTREHILDIIKMYPELIKLSYASFAAEHQADRSNELAVTKALSEKELLEVIRKTVANAQEAMIFESFVTFNKHVLKTNFYQSTKVALSFRMNPAFLPDVEYPQPLYGMFLVVGGEFRGFHLRFRDIARGGIRVVKSRNREAYSINLRSLFDENYGLANTQQRKNKDIPEGGSKGTILLDAAHQDTAKPSFEKYVDAILDLVVPPAGSNLVDKYGKPEILFFGPDENTADFMDWASLHAKKRGAGFWKAFTTGKSQSMGGIPHDTYGMTTRSVHQYVLGILRKLGIQESAVTKMQMGGPDGDLGSNEILISEDKTIGIVDGSGVVYDPVGLDRGEIERLAKERKMISHFNVAKLGPKGFRVLLDDVNVKLPDGTVVDSGLKFRNEFHLNPLSSADLFVPCGGRPEAVDLANVHQLFNPDGTPRFKYIVEGANLFITQDARLKLEAAGVLLYKDASANKGGVTSSSLEVLAALSFNDAEFKQHMAVTNGVVPAFYAEYVKSVQNFIETAATMEFECLWRESQRTKLPNSILSDNLSVGIVRLNEELQNTTLWENEALRRVVLAEAFPKLLIDKLGLDTLLERVPENYVKAIFGSYLSSRFIYKYGTEPSQFAFFEFLAPYFAKIEKK